MRCDISHLEDFSEVVSFEQEVMSRIYKNMQKRSPGPPFTQEQWTLKEKDWLKYRVEVTYLYHIKSPWRHSTLCFLFLFCSARQRPKVSPFLLKSKQRFFKIIYIVFRTFLMSIQICWHCKSVIISKEGLFFNNVWNLHNDSVCLSSYS